MFEEGQLYSPVTAGDDGSATVHLSDDHPGAADPAYRARRNEIAAAALAWQEGEPLPHIAYTEAEHEVWRVVSRELGPKHARLACADYLVGAERLRLPDDRVPQLDEVSERLSRISGFELRPAAGLVPLRDFYGSLADRRFHSTQYLRHQAVPLYTPEPDLIHEVIGHCVMLASPNLSELHRLAGEAARRVETDEALQVVADVFWFSVEFGVLREAGEVRAYGAGLLSSYGEIEEIAGAELRPIDIAQMATLEYDITHYQPILFCGASIGEVMDLVGGFFAACDDDTPARLGLVGSPS
jgi:phenylalanine-4-hydroxylase